jgi:NADH:ubiquinone oxidoreductase subunit E
MDQSLSIPLAEIRERFKGRPEDLIPMLQAIQRALGYLPEGALLEIARLTGIPSATVYGVATFYEQFRLKPVGRHIVKLCRGTACHVKGADRILNELRASFHVEPGETTEDGTFTLETVACFGSCALAPVVVVNETVRGRMSPSKTREALQTLPQTAALPAACACAGHA